MVKIGPLPTEYQRRDVVNLIYGAAIEEMVFTKSDMFAKVTFCTTEQCKKYYDSAPNGIDLPNSKKTVFIELDPLVMPVVGLSKQYQEAGVTRVIQVSLRKIVVHSSDLQTCFGRVLESLTSLCSS